jgi:hypothetical protein
MSIVSQAKLPPSNNAHLEVTKWSNRSYINQPIIYYRKEVNMKIHTLMLLMGICLTLGGCKSTPTTNIEETQLTEKSSSTDAVKEDDTIHDSEENIELETLVTDNVSWYDRIPKMYSPSIHLESEDRDDELIKKKERILFPKSEVLAVTGSTNGSVDKFQELSEEDVLFLISMIENTTVLSKEEEAETITDGMKVIAITITFQTQDGKCIEVYFNVVGDDRVDMHYYYENDSLNEISERMYSLKSVDLAAKVKDLSGYKIIDLSLLQGNIAISTKTLDGTKEVYFTKDMIDKLVSQIGDVIHGSVTTMYGVPIKIISESGEEIDACIFDHIIGIGSTTYAIKDDEFSRRMAEYFIENDILEDDPIYLEQ